MGEFVTYETIPEKMDRFVSVGLRCDDASSERETAGQHNVAEAACYRPQEH